MKDLPHWNLDEIFPGSESPKFLKAIEDTKNKCDDVENSIINNTKSIIEILDEWEIILASFETLNAYSYAILSVDTENPKCLKAVNQVSKLSLSVSKCEVSVLNYLGHNENSVKEITKKGASKEAYAYVLTELLEKNKHLMSVEKESLAADLNRAGIESFSRLQESLASSCTVDYKGEKKTVTDLRSFAYSPDRIIRKEAFDKELEVLINNKVAYAAALNGVKGATLTLDKERGLTPLKNSLIQSRIDKEVLDALISTIEKNLPMFRKYLKAKAKLLKLDNLAFYDIFAPVSSTPKEYSYEEAREFILKQFNAFSPKMGDFAKNAFDNNWIDAEPRSGKIGGAYDTAFPDAGVSRIMCNFDGTYNGLSTMAHELGHAYHDSIVLSLSPLLGSYPMTLAETASIFSETVILQGALKGANNKEKVSLTETFLQNTTQVCVDILCRYYFESEVYKRREECELTPDEFNEIMVDCQKKTYGELSEYHPLMWAVKGHYYIPDLSFYNYPYAFGQLFALGVYAQKDKMGDSFASKYRELLALTGSNSARDVAATISCDISSSTFWQGALDTVGTYVEEFINAN
ncbi:MAG: M3 family oligoendopeptidase [Spirochaetaceae bacterium]|nr:M3 family oligoendopeptidase [Spirochaetaceae bacterium]